MLHLPGLGLCTVAKQKRRYILWYNALEKLILFRSQSLDRVRAGSGFGGDEAAQNGQHSC